jgi:putative intracellular protease/amidase
MTVLNQRRRDVLLGVIVAAALLVPNIVPAAPAQNTAPTLTLPAPKSGRVHPLVAIVADNVGAETTDFTIPYGVLKESKVADVVSVSTGPGPVQLMPALKIEADRTMAQFDAANPEGADIVIVPAQHNDDNPKLVAWIRKQYDEGATVVSICTGAMVVARAGLFDGKSATTHWHAIDDLEAKYPRTHWVRDRRYVQDGRVISTTGVTASMPVSLALVEAIAGPAAAAQTAKTMGLADWGTSHRSAEFSFTASRYLLVAGNYLSFWRHETIEAPVKNGFDEVQLALSSDAWSQSFLAKVVTTSAGAKKVVSRHGLVLVPDAEPAAGNMTLPAHDVPSLQALDRALADIDSRYGKATGDFAAVSLEYERR